VHVNLYEQLYRWTEACWGLHWWSWDWTFFYQFCCLFFLQFLCYCVYFFLIVLTLTELLRCSLFSHLSVPVLTVEHMSTIYIELTRFYSTYYITYQSVEYDFCRMVFVSTPLAPRTDRTQNSQLMKKRLKKSTTVKSIYIQKYKLSIADT